MGGDGGIMRLIQVLEPLIDLGKIAFVALPFGSGNDMAQTLNWGATMKEDYLIDIQTIVKEIVLNTRMKKVNIWETVMTFRKQGDCLMVDSGSSEQTVFNDQQLAQIKKGRYVHKCYMLNYFSMGECAKIGFEMEKKRTQSRIGNVCMYILSGMKRICCACCWTQAERVPLNEQIKYARLGSDIQNQTSPELKMRRSDSIATQFRKDKKQNELKDSKMSLNFR